MYKNKPAYVYGFHAIDKEAAIKILNHNDEFKLSTNDYDWLGEGTYFWENNLERAWQYAKQDSKRQGTKIKTPYVLGTIIDLGNCLDLLDQKYIDFLKVAYEDFHKHMKINDKTLPENSKWHNKDFDFGKRKLDCAVITWAHSLISLDEKEKPFDTVRAALLEGDSLYPDAGFRSKNHIQIAVLNHNCIKGIFIPREMKQK